MSRGKLYSKNYSPQFSGHETFPLRYGWLKKAYDRVWQARDEDQNKSIFTDGSAIATFGVGKNMVSSIRYWAQACGIIENVDNSKIQSAKIGDLIFGENGLDPFMENVATLWLTHWKLCGQPDRTTWYFAFNHFHALNFERETLVKELLRLASERGWSRVSPATVKKDVECFVRTYAAKPTARSGLHEESLESPLVELNLLKATGKKDGFRFVRGEQSSLGQGVFAFAVAEFWKEFSGANSLSFEALAHEPGSPGRVFNLDENELLRRLSEIEDTTNGKITWSETAGLKQISRRKEMTDNEIDDLVKLDFKSTGMERAA